MQGSQQGSAAGPQSCVCHVWLLLWWQSQLLCSDLLLTTLPPPTCLPSPAGFRSPYLVNSATLRKALYENGFLYDSSINELFPSDTSANSANRLYPYSMDYGVPEV